MTAPVHAGLARHLDRTLAIAGRESATPGAQAAVVRDGAVVWTGCHGVADRAAGVPVTDETTFCLASLGKTLVATVALALVEEQRLDLEAPIGAVLGDEVPGSDEVTAQMLLSHTSGYPDLYDTPEVAALMQPDPDEPGSGTAYDPDRPFTWQMLLPGIREPVEPGARWEYSNAGYIVLTEMLVRILGGPDALTSAWTRLAAGADGGITDDILTMDRSTVQNLAHGYDQQSDGSLVDPYAAHEPSGVPTDLFGLPFGDGLFAGTATGAGLFLDGLFVRGRVLDPSTVDLMTTATPQASCADVPDEDLRTYGLGALRFGAPTGVWHGHRGRYGGFTTLGASDRTSGATLVVLSNLSGPEHAARHLWRALAATLGHELDPDGGQSRGRSGLSTNSVKRR